jgi:hypothetical protein
MDRREFMKICGLAGLGMAAPVALPEYARAEESMYEGPYYLVFNASGGWDTTYLMDPKGVNDINYLYREGDIRTHGAHVFAPTAAHIQGGMSNEAFFTKYGSELLTVNGLDYSVNNHDPGHRYMATGKLDSLLYPTFAALVAACKGQEQPMAFLTFGNYSATGNLVPMTRIPYLWPLRRVIGADYSGGNEAFPYHEDFVHDRVEQALQEQLQARSSMPQLPRVERAQNMLYGAQLSSKALKRIRPYIPETEHPDRLPRQIDVALAGFKAGICTSANLDMGQFDSHDSNDPDQLRLIPEFLAGIDYAMEKAETLAIRDKLVVIIQSEMGRTPWYNQTGGKDHWSVGSIMFMGHGIRGNRVIGATDDGQRLMPINPETLDIDEQSGIRVRPEHIHLALREHAGIDNHPFARRFEMDVEPQERLRGLFG